MERDTSLHEGGEIKNQITLKKIKRYPLVFAMEISLDRFVAFDVWSGSKVVKAESSLVLLMIELPNLNPLTPKLKRFEEWGDEINTVILTMWAWNILSKSKLTKIWQCAYNIFLGDERHKHNYCYGHISKY